LNTSVVKEEITLSELLTLLRQQIWLVVAIVVVAIGASVAYAKLATEWFRAEVLMIPAEQKNAGLAGGLGALGGLAGIAGINLGNDNTAEPVATLQSHEFIGAFIEDQKLLTVLFADDWDAKARRWKGADPKRWPDLRDGIRYFDRRVIGVAEDTKTHLVTLTIEWTDPVAAARWANLLVERLNARMRDRALRDAERNVTYLREELGKADVITLQESVTRLLENEMQKMMVARGNSEYSFRVVDRASTPKWRSSPKRIQVVILGSAAGGILAVFIAVLRGRSRKRNSIGNI
jgi:uncharacterized protein involved in exopolysaccharide biosynthesis